MKPKKDEISSISKAIYNYYELSKDDLYVDPDRIAIIRNYVSDCPSWCGQIAFVVFGEVCYQLILIRPNDKSNWKVYKDINEKEMLSFDD